MKNKGYIKIHRELLDSEVFAKRSDLKIWLWLLLKASYKVRYQEVKAGRGFSTVKLEEGDLLFGRMSAEEELHLDGSMIYRTLKKFEDNGMIFQKTNNQYTIISIANWEEYQGEDEQDMNEIRTANEQDMNEECTTYDLDMNTNKKVDKDNKVKKDIKGAPAPARDFEEFSDKFRDKFVTIKDIVFPEWIEKTTILKDRLKFYLFEFRPKTNKKLKNTGTSITRIIKRLEDDCGKCPDIALANLEYSITKSYDMIYPEPARQQPVTTATAAKPFDIVDYVIHYHEKLKAVDSGPFSWRNQIIKICEKEYDCVLTEFIDQNIESLKAITDIVEFAKEIKTAVKHKED